MSKFLTGIALATIVAVGAIPGAAQLNGAYTIDPNGSGPRNYTTFGAAVQALNAGISANVAFTVAPATYKETVQLAPINGASASKTVTFICQSGQATIDANNAQDAFVLAKQTQYVILENLKITKFTKHGLRLQGLSRQGADNNVFTNIEIDGPQTSSSTVRPLSVEYSNGNVFTSLKVRGGGYTMYSQQMNRNTFESCEFDGKNTASRILAPYNSNDSDNLFQNCFVHSCGPTGYGCYINLSNYGNMFWHNTVIVTSSNAAAWMGSCCAWSRACSWRNNIIVNLGTGPAVKYGETSTNKLERFDADYNCYFAPNATGGIVIETERGTFKGSLAAWQTYISNNPGFIQTGGGTHYDQNSIETDPQLTSMTAPFDIHLKGVSPCLDAGTTKYVAGNWISYNQNATVPTDFEGHARSGQVDIGADEIAVSIQGSGSPSPGGQIQFDLTASSDPGLAYVVGSSFGPGPIPIGGGRKLGLTLDPLLDLSVNGRAPALLVNYTGFLDQQGKARALLNIPPFQVLIGNRIYTAFVTLKNGAPLGVNSVSNTFAFSIR